MAACLITISGTSGEVLIRYVDSTSTSRSLISGIGTLYLEDDGTDYTWTTLSGDAVAASGCITLTEVDTICYVISWEKYVNPYVYTNTNLVIDALILGSSTYSMTEYAFPRFPATVGDNINALNLEDVKAVGYKIVAGTTYLDPTSFYLIVKVRGTSVPYLRVNNPTTSKALYLKGEVSSSCLPTGYTLIDTCSLGTSLP